MDSCYSRLMLRPLGGGRKYANSIPPKLNHVSARPDFPEAFVGRDMLKPRSIAAPRERARVEHQCQVGLTRQAFRALSIPCLVV